VPGVKVAGDAAAQGVTLGSPEFQKK